MSHHTYADEMLRLSISEARRIARKKRTNINKMRTCTCGHKLHGKRLRTQGIYLFSCLTKNCDCQLEQSSFRYLKNRDWCRHITWERQFVGNQNSRDGYSDPYLVIEGQPNGIPKSWKLCPICKRRRPKSWVMK